MNSMFSLTIIGFILVALSQYSYAQGMAAAPSPAPIAPSNDVTTFSHFLSLVCLYTSV
ncbi:hypothetical protein ACJIZ3_019678 [Penstemon smallii]|uniref:Uncharacterized protein n=1 Tax=Penstemon smallii TaxID=265156 RepID=A0ABD3T2P8_9LAMI